MLASTDNYAGADKRARDQESKRRRDKAVGSRELRGRGMTAQSCLRTEGKAEDRSQNTRPTDTADGLKANRQLKELSEAVN